MNINLTLFAQAITFAAFIWFTVKFIWPWLLRKIEERQKTIADGLAAAEQGRRSLELSTRQADEAIKEARARAGDCIRGRDPLDRPVLRIRVRTSSRTPARLGPGACPSVGSPCTCSAARRARGSRTRDPAPSSS